MEVVKGAEFLLGSVPCALGPREPVHFLLGSWGQSALSLNHAWRVLFFIQKQHDEQEFNLAGALSVEAYFLLI